MVHGVDWKRTESWKSCSLCAVDTYRCFTNDLWLRPRNALMCLVCVDESCQFVHNKWVHLSWRVGCVASMCHFRILLTVNIDTSTSDTVALSIDDYSAQHVHYGGGCEKLADIAHKMNWYKQNVKFNRIYSRIVSLIHNIHLSYQQITMTTYFLLHSNMEELFVAILNVRDFF